MLFEVFRFRAKPLLALVSLPPQQLNSAFGFPTEFLVVSTRRKAIVTPFSVTGSAGISGRTLGVSGSGVTLEVDEIPNGVSGLREFSRRAIAVALLAFSNPSLGCLLPK